MIKYEIQEGYMNIYLYLIHIGRLQIRYWITEENTFLSNDTIFINVHYNDMIDIMGRKLMVGDVIELPHLLDYNPLNDDATLFPTALKRFYQYG